MTKIDSISSIAPIDGAPVRRTAAEGPRPSMSSAALAGRPARTAPQGAGEWLMNARAAIESVPRVDAVKVARLKAMLANGDLPFDGERVADCILDRHGMVR